MRWSLGLAAAFVCAAVTQPHPSAAAVQQQPDCREFTSTVTIDGRDQQVVGQVCRQPDGSWQIVQENTPTAGVPPQAYPYPYAYPYYWDGWGPPFLGSVFVFDRFGPSHGFHHHGFRDFDHHASRHGGFHHFGSGSHGGRTMMGGRGGGHR
jgi:surface antigen